MTETWFDKTCDARGALRIDATELEELSHSCDDIGLSTLGVKLYNLSKSIWQAELDISKAIGQGVNEAFKVSEQSANNMLMATLVGTGCVTEETLEKILNTKEDQE